MAGAFRLYASPIGSTVPSMRNISGVVVLLCGVLTVAGFAQERVAEGEYQLQGASEGGASQVKTATRWVLTSGKSGAYHLESEIQNQPAGTRVVQVEELNDHLAPVAIGYELYRNNEQQPGITVRCELSAGSMTCGGLFEGKQVTPSAPYKLERSFWLWMEGLFALDMPWLLDGTVNMAQLQNGSARVPTVTVSGGTAVLIGDALNVARLKAIKGPDQKLTVIAPDKPVEWNLSSDEESLLEFAGTKTAEIDGIKTAAKHYTLTNGDRPMDVWVSESGLLLRMSDAGGGDVVLANYRQYKPLIKEIKVENASSGAPGRGKN